MARKTNTQKRWSHRVTKGSNALDLEQGVFTWSDPQKIARSLKRSAEQSTRRKGTPLQSAMSMLNFYVNRAGKNLDSKQKKILQKSKEELRDLFGKGK
jgi:putative cell wall-binding protein